MMETPGWPLRDPEAAARPAQRQARPRPCRCPAFLIRHPSAGAILVDTGLHPSIATDGKENFGGLGARFGKPGLEAGEGRAGAAARARPRPGRDPDRGDDPHAHRPHLGDLGVPQLDLRRQRDRVGGRRHRIPARCSTATAAPTTTTPSTTARSTSTAAASTPTRPSAAPSTSSATARSASPTPRATAPATCR